MRNLNLTLSLILGLATSVSANNKHFSVGDVFFCQMEEFVSWEWKGGKGLVNYRLEKFKFTISDRNTLQFGQEGYLSNAKLNITHLGTDLLKADEKFKKMSLERGNFNYVASYFDNATLIAAICDRF